MKKTAMITGASAGIGAAFAKKLASENWRLILIARRMDKLKSLVKAFNIADENVHLVELDVRNRNLIAGMTDHLPESFRQIDLLVNNAGLARGTEPVWEYNLDDWDEMVDTNIKGLLYITRTVLPLMVKRNSGQIINLGSIAGNWPYPGGNVYGGTKAFVQQFTRNLRTDLLGKNIRVTNIEPGIVDTEFSIVRYKGDMEKAKMVYENANALQAEDIAEIGYWLTTMPEHVNINAIEVMPVSQAWGPLSIHRSK